jgi:hypothetical protein
MKQEEFKRLNIHKRYELLKADGDYIGARDLPQHFAYLYAFHGYFVEVYMVKSLNQIQWIEVQTNRDILQEYVDRLDLGM